MEIGRQQYISVVLMPIKRFYDYMKWKTDLEEEKSRMIESAKAQMPKQK